mgnify:CR=1 FL=1
MLFRSITAERYALVRETFATLAKDKSDHAFAAWLAEGVLAGSGYASVVDQLFAVPTGAFAAPELSFAKLEARLLPSVHAGDGLYANNGWLAEAPDPLSKTVWENVILVSPKLAAKLAIEPEAMVINKIGALNRNINQLVDGRLIAKIARLTVDGVSVTGPVFIMPGLADHTVGLQLGFGRKLGGRVATRVDERLAGRVTGNGFDVYPFLTTSAPAFRTGVTIELTGGTTPVCNMQDHWSIEIGRAHV